MKLTSSNKKLLTLSLGALGVVFGDIGTSPLYSLKECFNGPHGVEPTPENVLGILSLVVWALIFVVTVKYLVFFTRADNRGEGGVLALLALVSQRQVQRRSRALLIAVGLFGSALLYADGFITPAITVIGAVEGLAVAAPGLEPLVVPLTVGILLLLFLFQKNGTATVGAVFGPIMLIWFLAIAIVGVRGIVMDPAVLYALSPHHAVAFFLRNRMHGFLVLAAVVLVITGGEALYADMGHFGRQPIYFAWLYIALPALLLNYLGQGALLLSDPTAERNPFYLLVPGWALYPMVGIATAAAIVASQALISGAFSLTNQAIQLGYCPRLTIRHTSSVERGQIYVPEVNWALGVGCLFLVLGFRSSSNLASTYGVALTGTMAITTLLFFRVLRDHWNWPLWKALPLTMLFLSLDLSFLAANAVKFSSGGWLPLATAGGIYVLMSTWKTGREVLATQLKGAALPQELFLRDLEEQPHLRVPGTAVFMTSNPGSVPPVLLHHLKHNQVLHERVLLVSIRNEEIPSVPSQERLSVKVLGNGFYQIIGRYGFMETPNIPALLASLPPEVIPGPRLEQSELETSYYLGRETLLPGGPSRMSYWRKRIFIIMARNAQPASAFFGLPPNRVVEMGAQIQF